MRSTKTWRTKKRRGDAYLALELTNNQSIESLAGLVTVANILEGLSGILTANVEQNLLTTTIVY